MRAREDDILRALEAFADGRPGPVVPSSPPPPLEGLRSAADILRTGSETLHFLRPFVIELFRAQNEFNHLVVDLLEDLPWFGEHPERACFVERRLGEALRWRPLPPRRSGPRGALVFWTKLAFLAGAPFAWRARMRALERSNRRILEALAGSPSLASALLSKAIGELPLQSRQPLFRAQRDFVTELSQCVARWGKALNGLEARRLEVPRRTPCPTLSVVMVGKPSGPVDLPEVLEVLCQTVPAGSGANVRTGDVADAKGSWVLRLPDGEQFCAGPLFASALERPGTLVYGDAEVAGRPVLRPAWSPEYLWSESYVGGCFAIRVEVARQLTRSTPVLDWLLLPQFAAKDVTRVCELVSTTPAAEVEGGLEAVRSDLRRRGLTGEVWEQSGRRIVRLTPRPARVSIIVPFRDKVELLEGLWASLLRFDAGVEWELILASNQSRDPETFAFLAGLKDRRVRWVEWDRPFNFSAINNAAAKRATGQWLLFLNNDIEVRQANWLADLLGYAQVPGVGVVGARLLYGDGSLQHGGMVIGLKSLAGHVFARWRPEYGPTPFGWPDATRNWSAVTGACLLLERSRFERIGGFDERMSVSGGDIELCLRACRDGSRVVCVGHVALSHFESMSRGRDPVPQADVRLEARAYLPLLKTGDPHFHRALATDATSAILALQPDPPLDHALRAIKRLLVPP